MIRLHLAIPFLNDPEGLRANVPRFHAALAEAFGDGAEIVLCDDGSADGSAAEARRLAASLDRVRVVGYSPNRGRGFAVRFAARDCRGERFLFADLDLPRTTGLHAVARLAARLDDHDLAVGSRFHPDSETRRLWLRDAVGRAHRAAVRRAFPELGVRDPDAGFKAFRTRDLQRMAAVCREDRWSWDLEVLVVARANGLRIAEMPIDWNERHEGHRTSVRLARAAWEEWTGIRRIKRRLRRGLYALP